MAALKCASTEGIIPALEPSHAVALAMKVAKKLGKGKNVVVNLCGRGDKDMHSVAKAMGVTLQAKFGALMAAPQALFSLAFLREVAVFKASGLEPEDPTPNQPIPSHPALPHPALTPPQN